MGNVERSWMLFYGLKNTNSTNVISSGQVHSCTILRLEYAADLHVREVHLESVTNANVWVWESEGSSVMSHNKWNLLLTNVLLDDLAKFEASLFGIDSMWVESAFNIK